jgi:hypothetical protein
MTLERFGVVGSELDGVFFTEARAIAGSEELGPVKVEIGGQNKDLRNVKAKLAEEVRRRGGDGLIQFAYGQRGNPWWRSLSGLLDAEHWYGSGVVVRLPRER